MSRTKGRTDAEWKTLLSALAYQVLREAGTERAFTGELWNHHELGTYVCGGCGTELFVSDMKFDSGCGWPSFFEEIGDGSRVEKRVDSSHGMTRTEIICSACGGHLGHVFDDGPPPTGKRYCVNSASLRFVPAGK